VISPRRLLHHGATVGLLFLLAPACTENDEQLVDNVGVTRLLVTDTNLFAQSVSSPFNRIQVSEWGLDAATVDIDGALVDLLFGEPCAITDTAFVSPISEGPCESGVVIESSDDPFNVTLMLSVTTMQVRRAEPLDLSQTVDYDGDGVPDDGDMSGSAYDAPCGLGGLTSDCDDNCPLVANADQADDNGDGVGNVCTVFDFFGSALRDSDGDDVPDSSDNCVWIFNPDQDDTTGVGSRGIPDGIGDDCVEQVAQVLHLTEGASFGLALGPTTLLQDQFVNTFLTVDFVNRQALSCDWDAGTCTLDPNKVDFCTHTNVFDALEGCELQARAERPRRERDPLRRASSESMKPAIVVGSIGFAKQRIAPHSRMRDSVSGVW
jgi:hypothetical protein